MKKRKVIVPLICAATVTATVFAAGCSGYTPEEGTNYFKDGEVYRVFEQLGEAEAIEDFALVSYTIPALDGTYTFTVSDQYMKGSMFFESDSAALINGDGVKAIYAALGISSYLLDEELNTCYLTNLYTYNTRISYSAALIVTMDPTNYPDFTVYGEVADVSKYTFTYTDYSANDGTKTGEGTFSVYISDESHLDTFVIYN